MAKLVSIELLDDENIKLLIKPMLKARNHYKVLMPKNCKGGNFFDNLIGEIKRNSSSYIKEDNKGNMWLHIQLASTDTRAKYVAVLQKSEWTEKYLPNITKQLLKQEENILLSMATRNQLGDIVQAIKSRQYCSLILKMIEENADSLTTADFEQIEHSIEQIKQVQQLH